MRKRLVGFLSSPLFVSVITTKHRRDRVLNITVMFLWDVKTRPESMGRDMAECAVTWARERFYAARPSATRLFTPEFVFRPSSQHTRGNQSRAAGNELKFPMLAVLPHLHIRNCWRENTSLRRPGRHRHRKIWLRKIKASLNIHQNGVLSKGKCRNGCISRPYFILHTFLCL